MFLVVPWVGERPLLWGPIASLICWGFIAMAIVGCSITPFAFDTDMHQILDQVDRIAVDQGDMLAMLRDLETHPGCPMAATASKRR